MLKKTLIPIFLFVFIFNVSLVSSEQEKLVLAYYYVWYDSSSWDKCVYHPSLGNYTSSDRYIINQQIYLAKEHGLDGFIISWHGQNTFSDNATKEVFKVANVIDDFKLAIMIERVGNNDNWYAFGHDFDNDSYVNALKDDLLYIVNTYIKPYNETYLTFKGKPVIVFYAFLDTDHLEDDEFYNYFFNELKIYLYEQTGLKFSFWSLNSVDAYVFDVVAMYLPQLQKDGNPQCPMKNENYLCKSGVKVSAIFPMYDDTKLRPNGTKVGDVYREKWEKALSFNPDIVLITSWNEWYESTSIEPKAGDWSYLRQTKYYVDQLKMPSIYWYKNPTTYITVIVIAIIIFILLKRL